MADVPAQVRMEEKAKRQAEELSGGPGPDLSDAGLPQYSREIPDAAGEARRISRDPNVPGYTDPDDRKRALEA